LKAQLLQLLTPQYSMMLSSESLCTYQDLFPLRACGPPSLWIGARRLCLVLGPTRRHCRITWCLWWPMRWP